MRTHDLSRPGAQDSGGTVQFTFHNSLRDCLVVCSCHLIEFSAVTTRNYSLSFNRQDRETTQEENVRSFTRLAYLEGERLLH